MKLKCTPLIKDHHFPLMCDWWEKRKLPSPERKFLPEHGLVVSKGNGQPIVGGFLVKTDANIAIIGHIVSDPESDKELRSEAVDMLIEGLKDLARLFGFNMISGATSVPQLIERYESHGAVKVEENVTLLGGSLWEQ